MNRRPFQFGVGKLLLIMAVVGAVLGLGVGLVRQGNVAAIGVADIVLLAAAPILLLILFGRLSSWFRRRRRD